MVLSCRREEPSGGWRADTGRRELASGDRTEDGASGHWASRACESCESSVLFGSKGAGEHQQEKEREEQSNLGG